MATEPAARPTPTLRRDAQHAMYQRALKTLPGKEREVFVLHRMEGRTLLHVAESTGLTLAQVRKLIDRATVRLTRKVWKD